MQSAPRLALGSPPLERTTRGFEEVHLTRWTISMKAVGEFLRADIAVSYSHSIVLGGFELMS